MTLVTLLLVSQLCLPILLSQGLLTLNTESPITTCPAGVTMTDWKGNRSRYFETFLTDSPDFKTGIDAHIHVHRRRILAFEDAAACSLTEQKKFSLIVPGPFPPDEYRLPFYVWTTLEGDCAAFIRSSNFALQETLTNTLLRAKQVSTNVAGLEVWGNTAFVPPAAGHYVCLVNVSVAVMGANHSPTVTQLELRGSAGESPFQIVGLSNHSFPQPQPQPTVVLGTRVHLFVPGSLLLPSGFEYKYGVMLHNPSETELLKVTGIRSTAVTGPDRMYLTVPGSTNMRWTLQPRQTLQVAEVSFAIKHVRHCEMRSLVHITVGFQPAELLGELYDPKPGSAVDDTVELVVPINVVGLGWSAAFPPPSRGLPLRWNALGYDISRDTYKGFTQGSCARIDRFSGEQTQAQFSFGEWFLPRADKRNSGMVMLREILFDTTVRFFVLLTQDDTFWGELWDMTLFGGKWFGCVLVFLAPIMGAMEYFESFHSFLFGERLAEDRKRKRGQKVQANHHLVLETSCKIANRLNVFDVKQPTARQLEYLAWARQLNVLVLQALHQRHGTSNWSTLVLQPDKGIWRKAPAALHDTWKRRGLDMDGVGWHGFGLVVWVRNVYAHSEEAAGNGLFADSDAVDEYLTTRFPWLAELVDLFKRKNIDTTQDWRRWSWSCGVTVATNLLRLVVYVVVFLVFVFAVGYLQHNEWLPSYAPSTAESEQATVSRTETTDSDL